MRLLKIAIILTVIACICIAAGLAAVNYVASKIIDESIAEMMEDTAADILIDNNASNSNTISPKDTTSTKNDTTANDTTTNDKTKNDKAIDVKESSKDNNKDSIVTPNEQSQEDEIAIEPPTEETFNNELKEINEQVPIKEKVEITKMVVSKLSASEISELSAMASGGIDAEEKRKAKELIYSRFTPAELEYLKNLYYKYANK